MLGSKFGWFWQLDGSETIMLNCSQSLLLPKIRVPISFFHPYLRVKSRGPAAQAVNNWLQICKFAVSSLNCAFHMGWCSEILLLTQVKQQLNQLQVFIYWISPIFQASHGLCLFQSFTQERSTQRCPLEVERQLQQRGGSGGLFRRPRALRKSGPAPTTASRRTRKPPLQVRGRPCSIPIVKDYT